MEIGGKIFTGAIATTLLAVVGHFATADGFVSKLEKSAQTEMAAQGIDDVTASFSNGTISRKAILDGDVSDEIKQKALATVAAIPGVAGANWAGEAAVGDGNAATANADGETAADPAVSQCQTAVNSAVGDQKLSFRSGSAYISPASNKILDQVAAALEPCSGLGVAVGGHTDGAGNAQVNKILSQERADRVRAGLIERGISENLVTATGYGAEQPLNPASGPEAAAQNRRIEFKIQPAATLNNNDAKSQQGE